MTAHLPAAEPEILFERKSMADSNPMSEQHLPRAAEHRKERGGTGFGRVLVAAASAALLILPGLCSSALARPEGIPGQLQVRFTRAPDDWSPMLAFPVEAAHPGLIRVITFRAWDVDYDGELDLLLDGEPLLSIPATGNDRWGEVLSVEIPTGPLDGRRGTLMFRSNAPPGVRYPWGVDILAVDALPLPAGESVLGDLEVGAPEIPAVVFRFTPGGGPAATVLTYRLFDVDYPGEVEILVNGRRLARAEPVAGNNNWSATRSLTIPAGLLLAGRPNTICFHNPEEPRRNLLWGVSRVAVGQAIPLPSLRAYGNAAGLPEGNNSSVAYHFTPQGRGDQVITFQAYDIDSPGELEISLNGTVVRTLGPGVSDDAWSPTQHLLLPADLVQAGQPNRLVFRNTYNPPHRYSWGVRSVLPARPLPAEGPVGRIDGGGDMEHEQRATFTFPGQPGGAVIRFRLWDIDTAGELDVLLNGALLQSYGPLTGDHEWSGEQVLRVDDHLVADEGLNTLTFSASYNPSKRFWWGVRGVSCEIEPRPAPEAPEPQAAGQPEIPAAGDAGEPMKTLEGQAVGGGKVSMPASAMDRMISNMVGGRVGSLVEESPAETAGRYGLTGGSLTVTTIPEGAHLYLDGTLAYRGRHLGATPLDLADLPAGAHLLRVLAPGYAERIQTVVVPEGSQGSLSVTLMPFEPFALGLPELLTDNRGLPLVVERACVPRVVDDDGDGLYDILCGDRFGYLTLFRQDPQAEALRFEPGLRLGEAVESFASPFPVDWDNDGRDDLLVGDGIGYITLYRNLGTGGATVYDDGNYLVCGSKEIDLGEDACPVVVDWDGDGRKDLLCGSASGQVLLYRNRGEDNSPVLEPARVVFDTATDPGRQDSGAAPFAVSDWNGDALPDIMLGTASGSLFLFLNQRGPRAGARNFGEPEPVTYERGTLYLGRDPVPCVVDFNRDGLPDLLVGNADGEVWFVPGAVRETPAAEQTRE
jgi:hypothetical protein